MVFGQIPALTTTMAERFLCLTLSRQNSVVVLEYSVVNKSAVSITLVVFVSSTELTRWTLFYSFWHFLYILYY